MAKISTPSPTGTITIPVESAKCPTCASVRRVFTHVFGQSDRLVPAESCGLCGRVLALLLPPGV